MCLLCAKLFEARVLRPTIPPLEIKTVLCINEICMTEHLLSKIKGENTDILHAFERQTWAQNLLSDLMQHNLTTFNHSLRVGVLSFNASRFLHLSYIDVEELTLAGFVHDIGKLFVPCKILDAGILDFEQKERSFKAHADRGRKIVEPYNHNVAEIISGHHSQATESTTKEPSDPLLKFKQHIISIADQVDSLISPRPYKKSWNPNDTQAHLTETFENSELIGFMVRTRMQMAA